MKMSLEEQTTEWRIFYYITSFLGLKLYFLSLKKTRYLDTQYLLNKLFKFDCAPVAQLDRALGYGPGGSGFKS